MERSIKNSLVLKSLCYIFIPILIVTLVLSFIYTSYIAENEDLLTKEKFEQTEAFSSEYIQSISRIYQLLKWEGANYSEWTEDIYIADSFYRTTEQILYLVIDTRTDTAYTNINEGYSIEQLKHQLTSNEDTLYCHINGKTQEISTNIDNSRIQRLMLTYVGTNIQKYNYYDIYTNINEINSLNNNFFVKGIAFNTAKELGNLPIILIPIMLLLTVVLLVYLIVALGHKKNYDGIYLTSFDKLPIEITGIAAFILMCLPFVLNIYSSGNTIIEDVVATTIMVTVVIYEYSILAIIGATIVKKIKSHTFWNSTVIYIVMRIVIRTLRNIKNTVFSHSSMSLKIILAFVFTLLISIILISTDNFAMLLLLFIFWALELWFMLKYAYSFMEIKKTLKNIYNGKTDNKLNEDDFKGELKEISKYINDIQSGFSNAVEQSLKSERMKTELITNVSHDIKTPLTSIINYVDLLKSEEIENSKAKEYIEVLDTKSQRLKKLIEDLVEASKASSGNLKLNIERINLVELINQTTGEFEDKFKAKNLVIEINTSSDKIYINADNRYMYRVIENVYSNIAKYALDNSRVYIDIKQSEKKSTITIKNISKEKLNITADELMQRFVRGDKSRTTEGSGLGLSISKSLTELQKGSFDITIDGDLFKVCIEFEK